MEVSVESLQIAKRTVVRTSAEGESGFACVLTENVGVTLKTEGQPVGGQVTCGEWFWIPPNSECVMKQRNEGTVQVTLVRFAIREGTDPFYDRLVREAARHPVLYQFRAPETPSWIQEFREKSVTADPHHYFQRQSHLYALLSRLAAHVRQPANQGRELTVYVERTRQWMRAHYDRELDVEEIAHLSGSSSRFYRMFRNMTGLSPHKYMIRMRLDASLRLLARPDASVMETAHAVGYQDEYYFSRLFKKHMGLSPSEYAACANKRIANLSPVFAGDFDVLGITPEISLQRGWSSRPEVYLRQVERARPDLIFTSPVPGEVHRALSEIAPVVMLYWKKHSWRDRLLKISRVLGLTGVAEWWLGYFDMKVANAQMHIRRHLKEEPYLLVAVKEEGFRVFGMLQPWMKDLFYDELHIHPPERAERMTFLDVTTLEEIAGLRCDNVLFLIRTPVTDAFCGQLEDRWCRLRSRRPKRCLIIRYDSPVLYNAAAQENLVDQTVRSLAEIS